MSAAEGQLRFKDKVKDSSLRMFAHVQRRESWMMTIELHGMRRRGRPYRRFML